MDEEGLLDDLEEVDPEDEEDVCGASLFLVMGAFGETMFRFQRLELTFWSILVHRQKRGMSFDQRMNKIEAWDSQTLGRLANSVGLPDDLAAESQEAVEARNYLAHRFMRDRAPFLHDPMFRQRVGEELAAVINKLDAFEGRLEEYAESLGVQYVTDKDLDDLGLSDPDPGKWIDGTPENDECD